MTQPWSIAVVIPTWNEQDSLSSLVASLRQQLRPAERILVADGGSTDATVAVVEQLGVELVQTARRGRGCQIAQAVMHLTEDVVVVAHADMRFPVDGLARIADWFKHHPDHVGGALGHRFAGNSVGLRIVEWFDRRRGMRGKSYGDQAQFFRRQLLAQAGGFPDLPIMEDIELGRRLRQIGTVGYLDCPVIVSARRFEKLGLPRTLGRNFLYRRRYRLEGATSCAAILADYQRDIQGGSASARD